MTGFRTLAIISGMLMTVNGAWAACPTGSVILRDEGNRQFCTCAPGYYGNFASDGFYTDDTAARCIRCPGNGLSVQGDTDGYHCFKLNVPMANHPGDCVLSRAFISGGYVVDSEIYGDWSYSRLPDGDDFTITCTSCNCGHSFAGPNVGCASISGNAYKTGTGTANTSMTCPSYNGILGSTVGTSQCSQNDCHITCPTGASDDFGTYTLQGGVVYWI